MLVLKLPRQPGAPADAAIGAGHVHDGGARFGGFEAVGLRDHVGDLIPAPTVFLKLTSSAVPQLNCARCASPLVIFFSALKFESVVQTSGYSSKRDAVNMSTSASFAFVGLL